MKLSARLDKFERFLVVMALEYYVLNKEADPIAGGVPYQEQMQDLRTWLLRHD
jgi:hypothetical protein